MKYVSLLIKPVSGSCNMRCKYCFYRDISDKRSVENFGRMSDETLETLVKKTLETCEEGCSFAFQGGEPTLAGLDFFKKLVAFVNKYNTKGVKVSYALQTNGLDLGDDWAEFFRNENFLIGVSLDGDKKLHEASRVDVKGKGTFSRIMNTIERFNKYGVDYNILCVLTSYVARHPEKIYRFFKNNGFKYIQFIPCLDPLGEERGTNFYSLTPKRFESFFKRIFDLWYADCKMHQGISIRHFDNWLGLLLGYPPENCAMSGRCATYFVVEANGSVYPCDFYVTDEWELGNIQTDSFEDMAKSERSKSFIAGSGALSEECAQCRHYYLCRGGCRRDRVESGDSKTINYYCEAYKSFFDYSIDRLREIASMDKHTYGL
jgi:uncharacterized protein